VADELARTELKARLGPTDTTVPDLRVGPEGLAAASVDAAVVINGVVGFAGLPATLATLEAGHRLGLANKESLIAAGPVVQRVRDTPGAELIPIDSEHCALHQCLRANEGRTQGARLVLTASGGPFRGRTRSQLVDVDLEAALAHPTWSMGPKITVDSSTLMNKGLEVIEAHELFGVDYDDIDVIVHPQSIVHSMVAYSDGTTMAQLSMPDMRLCIGYALAYPDRLDMAFGALDFTELSRLDFEPPDRDTFRCLDLAYHAGRAGETAPAWLNSANELFVEAFLKGLISWTSIADLLSECLEKWPGSKAGALDDVLNADTEARKVAGEMVRNATT
jgi:1-deoxy-D-xylulose-5-phosphate reductoisomerase